MPKICKNDLVILPKKLMKEFGGVNQVGICYKITSVIHLWDPVNMRRYVVNKHQYFNHENDFQIIPFKANETLFYITDIYTENQTFDHNTSLAKLEDRFARVEVARDSDHKHFCGSTHLGHILKHGDYVMGYDIGALNTDGEFDLLAVQSQLPDIILIRKHYPKNKRIWKLKRMNMEKPELEKKLKKKQIEKNLNQEENDLEDFCQEIEQDKVVRSQFKLLRDEEGIKEQEVQKKKNDYKFDMDKEMVQINELFNEMSFKEKVFDDKVITEFIGELKQLDFNKKKEE